MWKVESGMKEAADRIILVRRYGFIDLVIVKSDAVPEYIKSIVCHNSTVAVDICKFGLLWGQFRKARACAKNS